MQTNPTPRSSFYAIIVFFCLIIFIVAIGLSEKTFAQGSPVRIFLNDLRVGDRNNDVLELQKVLNRDVETRVAEFGAGSPGFETNYFGQATKRGVINFQNKYASEILRPAGEGFASGFVGFWTRLKLNQIILNASVAQTPVVQPSQETTQPIVLPEQQLNSQQQNSLTSINTNSFEGLNFSTYQSNEPIIFYASRTFGLAGTNLTLSGAGFKSPAMVNFGATKIPGTLNSTGNSVSFDIPRDAQAGRYDVSVSVGSKKSNSVPFMVTVAGAGKPVIEKVEPSVAVFGEPITITGRNFTRTGNIVTSGVGVVRNLDSADGKTLTFSFPLPDTQDNDISEIQDAWFDDDENLNWPVRIFVVNPNGISDSPESVAIIINI